MARQDNISTLVSYFCLKKLQLSSILTLVKEAKSWLCATNSWDLGSKKWLNLFSTEPAKGGPFGSRDGSCENFSRMSVRLNFGSAATNGTKKPEATVKASFRGQASNLRQQQQQQQQPVSIFYISDGRYKSESVPGELITILLLVVACLLFDLEALVVVQSQN